MTGLSSMLMHRVRGVRVVDLVGATCLVMIVLLVYGSKVRAGAEAARIAETTRQISAEELQVQQLRAARATLTRPKRLEELSTQYLHMGPIAADHETTPEDLRRRSTATTAPQTFSASPASSSSATPSEEAMR